MPSPLVVSLSTPGVQLDVQPWIDPVVDSVGQDPRSAYVERFWLPTLGPAAVMLLRRLGDELDHRPDGFATSPAQLSQWIGLRFKPSRDAVLIHTLDRLCVLGFARLVGGRTLAARRRIPTLTYRQLGQLSTELRQEHERWVRRAPAVSEPQRARDRLRRLAVAMVEFGDDPDLVERTIHGWGVHPAIAYDAVTWAREHASIDPIDPIAPARVAARAVTPPTASLRLLPPTPDPPPDIPA